MFRLLRFSFKTIVLLQLLALAFSAGMGAAYVLQAPPTVRQLGQGPRRGRASHGR